MYLRVEWAESKRLELQGQRSENRMERPEWKVQIQSDGNSLKITIVSMIAAVWKRESVVLWFLGWSAVVSTADVTSLDTASIFVHLFLGQESRSSWRRRRSYISRRRWSSWLKLIAPSSSGELSFVRCENGLQKKMRCKTYDKKEDVPLWIVRESERRNGKSRFLCERCRQLWFQTKNNEQEWKFWNLTISSLENICKRGI